MGNPRGLATSFYGGEIKLWGLQNLEQGVEAENWACSRSEVGRAEIPGGETKLLAASHHRAVCVVPLAIVSIHYFSGVPIRSR